MFASFLSALSGLNAAGTSIDSIGNDLANLNTTGYKGADLSFQDVVADVTGSSSHQIGSGVSSPLIFKNFSQGSLQTTGGSDDAAIQGDGFFVVRSAQSGSAVQTGTPLTTDLFTRAGDFQVDQNGILTTATGERVQGWSLNTATNSVNTSDPIGDIIVPIGTNRPAKVTTSFSADLNLDASSSPGATFSVPVNIYDSLGNSHVISLTFTKTDPNGYGRRGEYLERVDQFYRPGDFEHRRCGRHDAAGSVGAHVQSGRIVKDCHRFGLGY